jgi:hypothetical protein
MNWYDDVDCKTKLRRIIEFMLRQSYYYPENIIIVKTFTVNCELWRSGFLLTFYRFKLLLSSHKILWILNNKAKKSNKKVSITLLFWLQLFCGCFEALELIKIQNILLQSGYSKNVNLRVFIFIINNQQNIWAFCWFPRAPFWDFWYKKILVIFPIE